MKSLEELKLAPGETVFVDGIHEDVARLVIGTEGERTETVRADALPEAGRKEGVYLRVQDDGALTLDADAENKAKEEVSSLMDDVFGD